MPSSRTLFACDEFEVGEFHCPPEDPAWSQENSVGPGRHVVFPGTGVLIAQDGRDPVVADPPRHPLRGSPEGQTITETMDP